MWWVLPVVLLFLADAVPELAGQNFVYYLFLFLFGFFAVCDPLFVDSARRYRWPALVAGLALAVFWVLGADIRDPLPDPSWQRALLTLLGFAAVWLTIVGMMGFGKRYLDKTSSALTYLAEASYPLYILHQTVIVVLAFYIVQLALPIAVQAFLLFVLAVAGAFALYEIVRRVTPLRFLFGMRLHRRRAAAVTAPATDSAGAGGEE